MRMRMMLMMVIATIITIPLLSDAGSESRYHAIHPACSADCPSFLQLSENGHVLLVTPSKMSLACYWKCCLWPYRCRSLAATISNVFVQKTVPETNRERTFNLTKFKLFRVAASDEKYMSRTFLGQTPEDKFAMRLSFGAISPTLHPRISREVGGSGQTPTRIAVFRDLYQGRTLKPFPEGHCSMTRAPLPA